MKDQSSSLPGVSGKYEKTMTRCCSHANRTASPECVHSTRVNRGRKTCLIFKNIPMTSYLEKVLSLNPVEHTSLRQRQCVSPSNILPTRGTGCGLQGGFWPPGFCGDLPYFQAASNNPRESAVENVRAFSPDEIFCNHQVSCAIYSGPRWERNVLLDGTVCRKDAFSRQSGKHEHTFC